MARASLAHRFLLVAPAIALALAAPPAAAQTPPSDLPPIPTPPTTAPPASGPAQPPPVTPPGNPVVPPSRPAPTGGYGYPGWDVPPGYGGGARYPYPAPYQVVTPTLTDPYAVPPPPPRHRRDMGLFVGGVIAVGAGMGMALLGSYFVASAADRIEIYCDMPSTPCAHKTDAPRMTGGALLMAAGAVLGAAGVPMWFVGSQYVADEKKAALRPEVRIGPGGGTVTLRF